MSNTGSNKMAMMPVGKLLFSMSMPAVFSMLIQSLYNIVDSIYVAQLGQNALFAMGLVYPMQMLSLSIGLGCGVGTNALVAKRLGQKRVDHASQTAMTGLILAVVHSMIIMIIGLATSKLFLGLFTDSAQIIEMGSIYLYIVMGFSLGQHVQIICEKILQSTGNMIVPMYALLISALSNIILDPIFIFGYFGIPAMGVAGAALATVIGQWIGMSFILYVVLVKDHDIHLSFKGYKFNWLVVNKIYKVGIPTMIMNAIGSVTTTCMNSILVGFSTIAVNVLNIYFKVQSFIFMPVFGMMQGSMPILAYNYGSQDYGRYKETIKYMILSSLVILLSGTIMFTTIPNIILNMFNPTPELLEIGSLALRVISLGFGFAAVSISLGTVFQSLGHGFSSMILSILRQLVFLVPVAYILGQSFGVNGVWWSYVFAESIVPFIFIPYAYKVVKKAFNK